MHDIALHWIVFSDMYFAWSTILKILEFQYYELVFPMFIFLAPMFNPWLYPVRQEKKWLIQVLLRTCTYFSHSYYKTHKIINTLMFDVKDDEPEGVARGVYHVYCINTSP